MGCSDEDAFRIAILCVHLNTVVGPSNSCTADADFLRGNAGMGLTELGISSHRRRCDQRGEWILITLTSLIIEYSFLLLPPLSLSQVNPLCIPLSSCCAPEP
jgi:hypothetical protein